MFFQGDISSASDGYRNDNLTGVRNAMIGAIVDNNTKEYYIKIMFQTKTMRIQDQDQDQNDEDEEGEKRGFASPSCMVGRFPLSGCSWWLEVIMEPVCRTYFTPNITRRCNISAPDSGSINMIQQYQK